MIQLPGSPMYCSAMYLLGLPTTKSVSAQAAETLTFQQRGSPIRIDPDTNRRANQFASPLMTFSYDFHPKIFIPNILFQKIAVLCGMRYAVSSPPKDWTHTSVLAVFESFASPTCKVLYDPIIASSGIQATFQTKALKICPPTCSASEEPTRST